jgi:hypothetical protein
MKRAKFAILGAILVLSLGVSVGYADPILSLGPGGGTITSGDKTFSNFTCSVNGNYSRTVWYSDPG